ncbi:MAG: lipid kinase [Geminicoccaceae bacterium]|nr:lipid kinase [Geminicoccaceae bacterium]
MGGGNALAAGRDVRAKPRRALCLINPNARQGQGEVAARIRGTLASEGMELVECDTGSPKASGDFLRRHADGADAIVIGGGDGTISEQLPLLLELRKPLGVLPLGTANDLARSLGLPLDPVEAAAAVAAGRRRAIDVGLIDGRTPFLNVASMGLTSMLSRRLKGETKRRLGRLGYWLEGVKAFHERKPFRVTITAADGRTWRRKALQLAVGNGRSYGGMLVIDEEAEIWDGLLHLYSVEPRPFLYLLRQAPGFFLGRLRHRDGILALEGPMFAVETEKPIEISADGEIKGTTPARFEVVRHALEVFIPEDASDYAGAGAGAR